jgi:hypothetical protein
VKGILLFARVPMNVAHLKPIYEALVEEVPFWGTVKPPKLEVGSRKSKVRDPRINTRLLSHEFPDVKWVSPWLASWLPLDIYLSPDIMLVGRRCRWKVHIFHGISFKGRAYTSKVLAYDRLFIIGPYMEERFIEKGILKEGDPRIARVGMPKVDPLVDGTWTREQPRAHLGLEGDAPVVLYAPTWGAGSSLEAMGNAVVQTVLNMGITLVVKLHDHTLRDPLWKARVGEWETLGVVVYRHPDIVPAMAASDLLISDLSSVANEYLLLDRPLIYLQAPDYRRRYVDTIDLKTWGFAAGPLVRDKEGLKMALQEALDHPRAYSDVRREMAAHLFYNPGHATRKAVDVIRELLDG